jgi:glycine betaine/choline ABC-type transport system substrate-binding protein
MPLVRSRVGVMLAAVLVLAGCGSAADPDDPAITIGSKGFTESNVLAATYAEALRRVGFRPTVRDVGSTAGAEAALRAGEIQVYPEYTGTYWVRRGNDAMALVGDSRASQAADVRREMAGDPGVHGFAIAPGSNNPVPACRRATGLKSLADLTGRGVSIAATPEAFTRPDAIPAVATMYGFRLSRRAVTTSRDRYAPIAAGTVECVVAYETDPEIKALDLVVLDDPKGILQQGVDYRPLGLANRDWWESLPGDVQARAADAMANVTGKMTTTWLRAAARRVAIGGESPTDVAIEAVNINVPGRVASGGSR